MKKLLLSSMACLAALAANAWSVYFTNPNGWDTVYTWIWNDAGTNFTGGSWPGQQMTYDETTQLWSFTYEGAETSEPEFIIFNMGSSEAQTGNLAFVADATYDMNGVEGEEVVTVLYLQGNGLNGASDWSDQKMTEVSDGVWTWSGTSMATGFKFNNGGWSSGYNIGAASDTDVMTPGVKFAVVNNSESKNIEFANGVQTVTNPVVTLNMNNLTVLVTGDGYEATYTYMEDGAVVMPTEGNEYAFNLNEVILEWEGENLVASAPQGEINLVVPGENTPVVVSNDNWTLYAGDAGIDPLAEGDPTEEPVVYNGLFFNLADYTVDKDGETVYGEYTLEVPAGLVENEDGELNPAQDVTVTVLPGVYGTESYEDYYILEGELSTITVTFPGTAMEVNESVAESIQLNGNNLPVGGLVNGTTVTFDIASLPVGPLNIYIPATMFIIDGNSLNYAFNMNYEIVEEIPTDGINSLGAENGAKTIYNLQGQKVNQMGKGLYIVNGKKVIVK